MTAKASPVGRIRKRLRSAVSRVRSRLYSDAADAGNTVFLLSSGRSGSTWLSAMLQSIPGTRTIFEPFHPVHGFSHLSRYRYRYVPPDEKNEALESTLNDVLSGRLRSAWSDQFNPLLPLTFRRRLIKEVRSNLLSPWLTRTWPNEKFLFLMRHPVPVALSQLKGGWELSSRRLYEQDGLVDQSGLSALSEFGWPTAGYESLVLFWALENSIALQAAHSVGARVVRYEDLVLRPEESLKTIEQYIGTSFPDDMWKQFERSSWSSRRTVGDLSASDKVNRWRDQASKSQTDFAAQVLGACELGSIYDVGAVE